MSTKHQIFYGCQRRLTGLSLYTDNAMGKLDDDRLSRMVADLEKESAGLKVTLEELNAPGPAQQTAGSWSARVKLAVRMGIIFLTIWPPTEPASKTALTRSRPGPTSPTGRVCGFSTNSSEN